MKNFRATKSWCPATQIGPSAHSSQDLPSHTSMYWNSTYTSAFSPPLTSHSLAHITAVLMVWTLYSQVQALVPSTVTKTQEESMHRLPSLVKEWLPGHFHSTPLPPITEPNSPLSFTLYITVSTISYGQGTSEAILPRDCWSQHVGQRVCLFWNFG